MRSRRLAAALIAVVALMVSAVSGCGVAETLIRQVGGEVMTPIDRAPIVGVDAPDASLANTAVVADAARSVVKTRAVSPLCQKILEGTGVVVAPNRVMTNAHAVAGANSFTVSVGGEEHAATVVSFDSDVDISILDVPGLQAPPLMFAEEIAATGTDAVVLGYPGGGDFVATPARIREVIDLEGPDIYRATTVKREVYTIRGTVRQGNTGGPVIDLNGRILGIVFGAAFDDPDTGFALTSNQVSPQMAAVVNTQSVATGDCVR
jgi:S1-C subfamily serine protease